jgi:surfeit locus 1 family protein
LPVTLPFGRRVFAPSLAMTALIIVLCGTFLGLGRWQWQRGNARQAEWDKFARGTEKVLALDSLGLNEVPRFQRVSLIGRFDAEHQFLLDNRTYEGKAGYEVLTPLERPDGRVALVDRGWVPFSGLRDRLPGVALKTHDVVTVKGRVDRLPSAGLASGRAAPERRGGWPKVTSYPSMSDLSVALGRKLEPQIVLLDAHEPDGYVRDWHPPGVQPIRHWSYAIQWWCFAALALVSWVILSTRKIEDDT